MKECSLVVTKKETREEMHEYVKFLKSAGAEVLEIWKGEEWYLHDDGKIYNFSKEGKLIDFAGSEGGGKSTQIKLVAEHLRRLNIDVVETKEPYGHFRKELCFGANLSPEEELDLLLDCRREHFKELVLPSLEKGRWVLVDGCSAKTVAYQGFGRGLEIEKIKMLDEKTRQGKNFDLIIMLDMDVEKARDRKIKLGEKPDRIEGEPLAFHQRVRKGYLAQSKEDPERWFVIDAFQKPEKVTKIICDEIQKRFFEKAKKKKDETKTKRKK